MRNIPLTTADIKRLTDWGSFPRRWRRLYLAQRRRCSLCGERISLEHSTFKHKGTDASLDHTVAKWMGGTRHIGNGCLAHTACNMAKGGRVAFPCERFFAAVTGEIVIALTPEQERRKIEVWKDAA